MKTITAADVEGIAKLAHLDVDSTQAAAYALQMTEILQYFNRLPDVAMEDGVPYEGGQPLRDDACKPSVSHGHALKNAPAVEEGCFKVPCFL